MNDGNFIGARLAEWSEELAAVQAALDAGAVAMLEEAELAGRALEACGHLLRREHPNEAAAWDLYHHQDVDDHAEVARLMGITVANSYKRVSRAQAWLKLYLLEQRREEDEG